MGNDPQKVRRPPSAQACNEITTDDVLGVLPPLWARVPETAERLRGRIESVLDAAKAKNLRAGENPARWKGHPLCATGFRADAELRARWRLRPRQVLDAWLSIRGHAQSRS